MTTIAILALSGALTLAVVTLFGLYWAAAGGAQYWKAEAERAEARAKAETERANVAEFELDLRRSSASAEAARIWGATERRSYDGRLN